MRRCCKSQKKHVVDILDLSHFFSSKQNWELNHIQYHEEKQVYIPSRGLTYPTLAKGKSSSKLNFCGIC